ncbi:MAG: AMP-binding protein, partial [Bifidobacteriaceae bacterium]|nr:AMP-binding protein [Bifidobacteriaceae bacterium]
MPTAPRLEGLYDLTPVQRRLVADLLGDRASRSSILQRTVTVRGPLDLARAARAIDLVARRHEALRAGIVQSVGPTMAKLAILRDREPDLVVRDLTAAGAADPDSVAEAADRIALADLERGFDLTRDSLCRVTLVRMGADESRMVWSACPAVVDEWSLPVLAWDFARYYDQLGTVSPSRAQEMVAGEAAIAPSLGRYLAWAAERETAADHAYWAGVLDGYAGVPPCPLLGGWHETDLTPPPRTPRPAATVDEATAAGLRSLAHAESVDLPTLVVAAWGLVVARSIYADDVVVGYEVSGRDLDGLDLGGLVGALGTTIPVRIRLTPGLTIRQMVRVVGEQIAEGSARAALPLADVERLALGDGPGGGGPATGGPRDVGAADGEPEGAQVTGAGPRRAAPPDGRPGGVQVTGGGYPGVQVAGAGPQGVPPPDGRPGDVRVAGGGHPGVAGGGPPTVAGLITTSVGADPCDPIGVPRRMGALTISVDDDAPATPSAAPPTQPARSSAEVRSAGGLAGFDLDPGSPQNAARSRSVGLTHAVSLRVTCEGRLKLDLSVDSTACSGRLAELTVRRVATALSAIVRDPDAQAWDLDVVDPRERAHLARDLTPAPTPFPEHLTLGGLVEAWAQRMPGAPAVAGDAGTMTFDQLNRRANQLAWALREAGIGREDVVALVARPGPEALVGIYAIAKAGGVWVALDGASPRTLLEERLEFARPRAVVIAGASMPFDLRQRCPVPVIDAAGLALGAQGTENLPGLAGPRDVACVVLAASGGAPRWVVLEHRSLVNAAAHIVRSAAAVDDAAVSYPLTLARDGADMAASGRPVGAYGCVETAGIAAQSCEDGGGDDARVRALRPIANTALYVLDGMRLCGVGMLGEVCVGGVGVARGYCDRPPLIAEYLIPNPFGPGRLFRTGDLGYIDADGRVVLQASADAPGVPAPSHAPAVPPAQHVSAVPAAPPTHMAPETEPAPTVPAAPQVFAAPPVPLARLAPEAPPAPAAPAVPVVPVVPATSRAPEAPEAPPVPAVPVAPVVPATSPAPEAHEAL